MKIHVEIDFDSLKELSETFGLSEKITAASLIAEEIEKMTNKPKKIIIPAVPSFHESLEITEDELGTHIEEIRPIVKPKEHNGKGHLPPGKWSRKYDACIKCHTTARKHMSKGFCSQCYFKQDDKYESAAAHEDLKNELVLMGKQECHNPKCPYEITDYRQQYMRVHKNEWFCSEDCIFTFLKIEQEKGNIIV